MSAQLHIHPAAPKGWHWAEWTILVCGVGGVVLAQTATFQAYACFAGLAGQVGWFNRLDRKNNPGMFYTSVVYASAWLWGFWKFWIA